ncbi:adhesion G protein-coupled receptor E5-like [Physella acuta]|uniref:adhesion G protein-coupled receptor E5-like n=1 Tax=Physella acuta TaxID=109671 RepID=UPI0027DE2A91|nr:adhesion G protein-coupled receptor E5-like [Physella acuta]
MISDFTLEITFAIKEISSNSPTCVYLVEPHGDQQPLWSGKGCSVRHFNSSHVTCVCNHMTHFGVLMAPYNANFDNPTMTIVTESGCGVSIACLVSTCLIYLILWKKLKGSHKIILMNQCLCLIIGYSFFIVGIKFIENRVLCSVVAAFTQYWFLASFMMALIEGIEVLKAVVLVFPQQRVQKYLFFLGYGISLVIVGVTFGATGGEGFGTDFRSVAWYH